MSFALYPDPPVRALAVAPGDTTVFTSFAPRSARVAEWDPPYPRAMVIRVAVFGSATAPALFLAVGTGPPVEVSADTQGLFSRPADTGYVGDVWLKSLLVNVFQIVVGLVSVDPAPNWRLGIRHADASERNFTWVVADSVADTAQPWVDPRPAAYSVADTVPVGGGPRHVGIDAERRVAYVANYPKNSLSLINLSTRDVIDTIAVGQHPFKVAVDTDTHTVYTANSEDSTVSVLEGTPPKVVATIAAVADPVGLAVDPARATLYAGCEQLSGGEVVGAVLMIDTGTRKLTHTVTVAHHPFDIAIDHTTHRVYATDFEGTAVSMIDPNTRDVTAIDVGRPTWGVAVDPVSGAVYVSCPNDNVVIAIEPRTRALTVVPVGASPLGLAVDQHALYVVHRGENTLGVVDLRTGATSSVPVGDLPMGVAVDSITHTAVVTNIGSDAATVVDRRPPP